MWKKAFAIVFVGILTLPSFSIAQIQTSPFKKGALLQIDQGQVNDIVFSAKTDPDDNPFDATFGAIYTGPDGQLLDLAGFYNGGNEWISRFSAAEQGTWRFVTYSSEPKLSGLTGELQVLPNSSPRQKGAVGIDPENPQAFAYANGDPHFMLAFELDWLFALDYGNESGLPKTEQLLDQVKRNGFNHVVANIYAYDVGWRVADDVPEKYFYGKPPYTAWEGSNDNPDFSRLNLDLFQHWDRVLASMQSKGLDAHLMIYVWNKLVNWPEMYSHGDNLYFDYIIHRYQAFSNVIWDVSKEALDYERADPPYIQERIRRIREKDRYNRLITVHDYEFNSRYGELVDFISIQSWRSNLYSLMLQGRAVHAAKPVVNIEHGGYETGPYRTFVGNYTSPETCLVRTYECVFAGVYGSYYWQNSSWNIVVHDPFAEGQDFEPPRFDYYKHLAGLFTRYNFNELQPSYPKITTNGRVGTDNLATNGYALSNGEGLYLMFIPKDSERVNAVLPKPASGKMKITWFNIFTGEYREQGIRNWSGWMELISPWQYTDSVVIVEEG
ncbi:apiosidase-like domain-containing protein [Cyclobacterium xiamenense]|uniref:apiosidase-like domain-containing protein n=1 Tax=Cyclobacterium xiamenense TaxID=1297121 RepID=UPI0012B9D95E|nr:DUF4038 domain-containing protein [Cyclobacterium xiamenense]